VGNNTTDAKVTAQDVSATRANQTTPPGTADITNRYDFDRDQDVDSVDVSTARDNQTTYLTMLNLVSIPE
jgi:hypothetical protein